MKNLIIIPGFGETGKENEYKTISKNAKLMDYNVFVLVPEWGKTTMSECVQNIERKLRMSKIDTTKTTLLGFSFGSYIGLELCKNYNFKKFMCCSCAPYFKENLVKIPNESAKFFGKKLMNDFKNFSMAKLKNLSTKKIHFFFGDKDWVIGIKTAQKIALQNKTKLQLIKNTQHVLSPEYIKILSKKIR